MIYQIASQISYMSIIKCVKYNFRLEMCLKINLNKGYAFWQNNKYI